MKHPLVIFLAEDNPADVDLIREAFREHDIQYALKIAEDGLKAKRYIEGIGTPDVPCPDLILLDLNLPKASGFELLQSFRQHPMCLGTPVIVVTSSNSPKDREKAAALGAAHYFRKPTDLAEFLELGSIVLEVARGLPG